MHSDTHDVFVFQTHGTKVWEVARPDADASRRSVVLEPGLSACTSRPAPRTPPAPRTRPPCTSPSASTRSPGRRSWTGRVGRALDGAGDEHLPAGYLDDPALLADGLADRLEALAAALRGLDPDAVADAEVRRFLTGRTLWQRGGLRRPARRAATSPTTRPAAPARPPVRAGRPRASGCGCCSATAS